MALATFVKSVSIIGFGAALLSFSTASSAQALTLTQNATDQGWWSTSAGHSAGNPNYITGQFDTSQKFRSYFTFNLSGVPGGELINSAILKVVRASGVSSINTQTQTLGLFDVSTSASALDQNSGPNVSIFNDLGTGTSYGTYAVSTVGNSQEILSFVLNSSAIANLNSALGSTFSIGGALQGLSSTGNEYLFGSSGQPAQLVLNTAPATPVPTPALLPGLIGLGFSVLRKRKAEAAQQTSEV